MSEAADFRDDKNDDELGMPLSSTVQTRCFQSQGADKKLEISTQKSKVRRLSAQAVPLGGLISALRDFIRSRIRSSFSRYLIITVAWFAFVIASAWIYTSNFPMWFEESGYVVWRSKFEAIESCSTGSNVILGDSRAQSAFVSDSFEQSSYNLAFGAATPLEVYLVFKRLAPCLTTGQHVLISVSPGEFNKVSPYLWENGVRYGFFSFDDLQDLQDMGSSINDKSFAQAQTRFGDGLTRDLIYGTHFPSIYTNNLLASRVFLRHAVNQDLFERAKARRGFLPFSDHGGATNPVWEASLSHFAPLPINDIAFRKTITLAANNKIILDFISAPLSQLSIDAMSSSYREEFSSYIAQLDQTHHTLKVMAPLFYAIPNRYFADDYHVLMAGADLFTDWLKRCRKLAFCQPSTLLPDVFNAAEK